VIALWHWFLQVTGTADTSGKWYAFWSGFGSDLGELALIGGLATFVHRENCASKGCWRLGLHPYEKDGVTHRLCRKCHPALQGKRHTREEFLIHHRAKDST
jgi:hypothetical protein